MRDFDEDWRDDERSGLGGDGDDWFHARERLALRRYRGVLMPTVVAVVGLVLIFVPSVYLLGLVLLLGGLAAAIITACLTFLGG